MKTIDMIKEKLKKLPIETILLITICIYIATLHIGMTTFNITYESKIVLKGIRYLCYIIFFINILIDFKFNTKEWKFYALFFIGGIITILSKDVSIIILLVILFSIKDISKEKIIKVVFYTNLIILLVTITCSLMEIIPNWTFERNSEQLRYSLGYQFCTFSSTYLMFIVLARFYLTKGRINCIETMLMAFMAIVIYYFGDARTGFLLILFILLSSTIIQIAGKLKLKISDKIVNIFNKVIKYMCYILPTFLAISFILLVIMYNAEVPGIKEIDSFLTGRLHYTNRAIEKYGITLLGKEIEWQGWGGFGYTVFEQFEYTFVDNSNMKIMLNYGVISLIILLYVFTKKLTTEYNKKDYCLLYCFVIVLLWSFIEPSLLELDKNIFMLILI